ncbi:bifunctional NUDIX hydrolase/phosphatase PAP2 family protein [Vibrio ziniensis]|uniref:NUDIX domain-containing protein n=1 Tax=Vibrio ziniensis TaxID=2711221 RepID=A0A6G7CIB7_9VIBR|nr:NUDIX domain-containing protein [Vibrio ziniensis]QIH41839.1 NUDIX domain-containing protein [Vibrio ziniensis]
MCVIKADDKLVLVNEIITKRLSVPGGTIRPGEPPERAAQRETWEETGIVVAVGDELGRTDKAVFFDCVSSSEIIAYQHQNLIGGHELPIWFAPDYGIEVSSATLVDPSYVDSHKYRYPDEWQSTIDMFHRATNQPIKIVADLVQAAPNFHQTELKWIQAFQIWVNKLPEQWRNFVRNLLFSGNVLASPICGIILFPLLYWRCGKSVCYKVSFAISITSLLCLFAQQGFALPRPHVYFPSLQLISSYGNGFPSLPIAVWSSIGILLMTEKDRLGGQWFIAVYLVSAIWLTLSKFYSGSAFIVDMAVGAFLGLLITWNIVRFDIKRTEKARTIMGSRRIWWGISLVAAVFTYYWQLPVFSAWLVVLVVMAIITTILKSQREYLSLFQCVLFTVILSAVYMSISYLATTVSSSGIESLVVEISRYPAIIIVFVLMIKLTASSEKPS